MLNAAHEVAPLSPPAVQLAQSLQAQGIRAFDALHLACAAASQLDLFFSTDDRLLRAAARLQPPLTLAALNPLAWILQEPHDD